MKPIFGGDFGEAGISLLSMEDTPDPPHATAGFELPWLLLAFFINAPNVVWGSAEEGDEEIFTPSLLLSIFFTGVLCALLPHELPLEGVKADIACLKFGGLFAILDPLPTNELDKSGELLLFRLLGIEMGSDDLPVAGTSPRVFGLLDAAIFFGGDGFSTPPLILLQGLRLLFEDCQENACGFGLFSASCIIIESRLEAPFG